MSKFEEIVKKIKAGNVNDSLLKGLLSTKQVSFTKIDSNLYFRITAAGTANWVYQYRFAEKQKRMTLGIYGKKPDGMPLSIARIKAAEAKKELIDNKDPLAERMRAKRTSVKTVDDVATIWLDYLISVKKLDSNSVQTRLYTQEIKPVIGHMLMADVRGFDISEVLKFARNRKKKQRPAALNDVLSCLKQLFKYARKISVIDLSPAEAFEIDDAGGAEKSRTRALSLEEIETVFCVLKKYTAHFTRENHLAIALLIVLCVRKGTLISARWDELDFENKVWNVPAHKDKEGHAIDIPLPDQVIAWFDELKIRAGTSNYVFPARRASKRREYISDDTLNHALYNLFGKRYSNRPSSTGNVLGEAGIEYFTIHDLRRSARTLLSKNGVPFEVAEKCLNHTKKGIEGIYNRDGYFEARVKAHNQLAEQIGPFVD